jgi:hypothetical protein
MPGRVVLFFDIDDRQGALRQGVAPDDVVLRRRDTALPFPGGALAYCADLQAERVLFSVHGCGLPALFAAPFLYAAQLADAAGVVSVPFERLGEFEADVPGVAPTLIFSPGRTGSTLLARLLAACGAACASEPDMLTQVCRFVREDRLRLGAEMEPALLRACLVSLCRALGPAPFIKLRSQCNARPLAFLAAAPAARVVFLLRRLAPWAESRHLAFGEDTPGVAAVLRQAVDALDKLQGAGVPFAVVWFEDLVRDPAGVLRGLVPGLAVSDETVARVMARDAQGGTSVARDVVRSGRADPAFARDFTAAWDAAREGAAWSAATLDLLAAASSPLRGVNA